MESGALGCEIILKGPLRSARSRFERVVEGYVPKSGDPALRYVKSATIHVKMKRGVLGVTVNIVSPDAKFPDKVDLSNLPEIEYQLPIEPKVPITEKVAEEAELETEESEEAIEEVLEEMEDEELELEEESEAEELETPETEETPVEELEPETEETVEIPEPEEVPTETEEEAEPQVAEAETETEPLPEADQKEAEKKPKTEEDEQ
jgi:ribosomal protein S3